MLGQTINRRDWLQETLVSVLAVVPALLQSRCGVTPSQGRIESIEHKGRLISDCSLAGETRRDDTVPAHPAPSRSRLRQFPILHDSLVVEVSG